MSKTWTFIGGILGVAGVFTAAAIAVELESQKSGSDNAIEEPEKLALPKSEGR